MSEGPSKVASERVAEIIGQRILSGELQPGQRIKQDELANELETSRIPVRDALRILETRGLVSLKANTGARVASLTAHDMDISYKIRERLEPLLLAESMPNLTPADIADMREIKLRMEASNNVDTFLTLNRQFHWAAFRGNQTPILAQIVERLWETTHVYRQAYARMALQDDERRSVMNAERELLLGSIERAEIDMAPRILALHIRRAHMGLLKYGNPLALLTE
jgi:DNA-binding GntR family transcriptional regulator